MTQPLWNIYLCMTLYSYMRDISWSKQYFYQSGSFYSHFTDRKITKKNNGYFGGLGILIKQHLRPFVKFLQNTSPEFQWLKLEKTYFDFDRDLFICVVYYPPSGSGSTYRISSFFRVSQILRKKGKLVHFLFCGSYFLRFKTIYRDLLWHTITNIISTCFIFGELKMVAKNAKIRLPRKKTRINGVPQNLTLTFWTKLA
jgi:hypothetical protein